MSKGLRFLACVVLGVLAVILLGLIIMSLWNWLVPALFNGPLITFWQGLGLLVLSKILFSGLGGKGKDWKSRSREHQWKTKFYDKFSSMSPDEREQMKQKMKEKWCSWQEKPSSKEERTSND